MPWDPHRVIFELPQESLFKALVYTTEGSQSTLGPYTFSVLILNREVIKAGKV
jgi:hypothetical protein